MAPPLNVPPVQLDLTPEPLPYKYLTLDAAHWTLTTTELQHLVSSAIRESAKEQFIRLLPPSIVDSRMSEDAMHIEHSWDAAAARWRFEAHRRNMLLRALSVSGADSDLLTQLSGTLSNLDSHTQNLLHAAAHRTQLVAARDTHRASALAVALRKLNASYARRTRELDKARAHIATLRSEVDEAWKVAEEQAAEVDKLKAVAGEPHELAIAGTGDSVTDEDNDEDDASGSALQDGASARLTVISRAEVVDVTNKAVAAHARLTMIQTNHHVGSRSPPSAYSTRSPSSPVMSGSNALQRRSSTTSQVSRVDAARKRSIRQSKASLRLPSSMSLRSRSSMGGESSVGNARSKSRGRKGKEPEQVEPPVPWIPADVEGSFLEMEGRMAGDEAYDAQVGSDGGDSDEGAGSVSEEPLPDSTYAGACVHTLPSTRLMDYRLSLLLPIAEPPPHTHLSIPASSPKSQGLQALPTPKADASQPRAFPLGDVMSLANVAPSVSASTPEQASWRSSSSLPSTSAVPSVASILTFPLSSESHYQSQPLYPQSNGTNAGEKVAREVDLLPDPASIFSAIASSDSTTTTSASVPDLFRRGHSLDLPSPSTNGGGSSKQQNEGSKIRRSISELLHFGSGSRTRRRSVRLSFKGRSKATGLGTATTSAIRQELLEESQGGERLENGWEDAREDEAEA